MVLLLEIWRRQTLLFIIIIITPRGRFHWLALKDEFMKDICQGREELVPHMAGTDLNTRSDQRHARMHYQLYAYGYYVMQIHS